MANARFFTSKLRMTKAALSSALATQPKSLSQRRPGRGASSERTASPKRDIFQRLLRQGSEMRRKSGWVRVWERAGEKTRDCVTEA
jgi:hypothetical protein